MKYTRYDIKKKRSPCIRAVLLFVATIALAIVLASILSKLFFKDGVKPSISPNTNDKAQTTNIKEQYKFIALQGGMYSIQENADKTKTALNSYGAPFCINEQGKGIRVFLGIFREQEAEAAANKLKQNNIDSSKMVFDITAGDLCTKEILEISDGLLQVLNMASETKVKSVQTAELKKWCQALKDPGNSSSNYSVLQQMKKQVEELPQDITKDKVEANYVWLYNVLKALSTGAK